MPSVRGVVKGSFPWFMVASSRSHPQTPASPADGPRGWSVTPEPKWPCLRNSDAEGKCPNLWQWKHMRLLENSEALWLSSRQGSLMSMEHGKTRGATIPIGKLKKKGKNPQKGACPKSKPDPKWDGQPTKKGTTGFPSRQVLTPGQTEKSTTQIDLQNLAHTNEKRKSTNRARSPL